MRFKIHVYQTFLNLYLAPIILAFIFCSCNGNDQNQTSIGNRGIFGKLKDENIDYISIVGRSGNVYVNRGSEVVTYKNYRIKYSNSDAATLLIVGPKGQEVYIQGPAVIEFYKLLPKGYSEVDTIRREINKVPGKFQYVPTD